MLFVKIVLLAGLAKLLIEMDQPFLCAGIYTVARVGYAAIFGCSVPTLLVMAAIIFALTALYYWLLDKLEGADVLWFVVLALGLPIALL